jgi:hypothetical protein
MLLVALGSDVALSYSRAPEAAATAFADGFS